MEIETIGSPPHSESINGKWVGESKIDFAVVKGLGLLSNPHKIARLPLTTPRLKEFLIKMGKLCPHTINIKKKPNKLLQKFYSPSCQSGLSFPLAPRSFDLAEYPASTVLIMLLLLMLMLMTMLNADDLEEVDSQDCW